MSYAIPPLQSVKKEKIFHMLFALLLYGVVAGCTVTDIHAGVYGGQALLHACSSPRAAGLACESAGWLLRAFHTFRA
jgi:hypothetical protein